MANTELHAIISGRVQGVGCRATVKYMALQHGLSGIVRNLANGSVEIIAQGPKESLQQFLNELYQIPHPIKITTISSDYRTLVKPYTDFRITP